MRLNIDGKYSIEVNELPASKKQYSPYTDTYVIYKLPLDQELAIFHKGIDALEFVVKKIKEENLQTQKH